MPNRLLALAALVLLAACDAPVQQDYTRRFPIGALPETVSLTVPLRGAADPFAGANHARFQTLVAGFLDRGHGALTVSAAAAAGAHAAVAAVRGRLIAAGVPASAIRTDETTGAAAGTVTLRYRRYDVVLPICGDWSAPMGFNPDNTDYPNFGCAIQRDLGMMLADPGDIVSMRATAPAEAQDFDRVLEAHRAGTSPEARQGITQESADENAATGSTPGNNTPTPAPAAAP